MTKSSDRTHEGYIPLKTKLRKLFVSKDFWIAIIVGVLVIAFAPNRIPLYLAKEVLTVSVSVLAIIFSVFFAGVAVIMTAGDNDFITFLQVDRTYSKIVWSYKATLMLLFGALVFSLVLLIIVLAHAEPGALAASSAFVPKWLMTLFGIISTWALFAALSAAADAIEYANLRARFIAATSKNVETSRRTGAAEPATKPAPPETPSPKPPAADAPHGPDSR